MCFPKEVMKSTYSINQVVFWLENISSRFQTVNHVLITFSVHWVETVNCKLINKYVGYY